MEPVTPKRTHFSDPFGRDPPPKAFYHPSRQKHLRKKERQIALSPNRKDQPPCNRGNPGEELFLKGTNTFSTKTPQKYKNDDHSSEFDESWPSSERPSYNSVIDSENTGLESRRQSDMMDTLAYLKSETHGYLFRSGDMTGKPYSRLDASSKGSVLQSYIERFRHGAPMSREERSHIDGKSEFWWLSHTPPTPSDTSTPKDDDRPRSRPFTQQGKAGHTDRTNSVPLTVQTLHAHTALDDKTRRLQDRADRLLEESTSSLHSSEPAVSTDGLGVSTTGTVSSLNNIPYNPVFTRKHDSRFTGRHDVEARIPRRPLKPDEDILYQWRLRRKIEVAQQGSGVTGSYATKDIDSKLDAFRRRLEGTVNPTPGVQSTVLHFTPAPASSKVERKVDAEVQTKESLESVESNREVSTPPRRKNRPEIASPTLARHKHASTKTDPHLHLMCDLLPCPHAEKYSQQYSKLYERSSEFSDTEESCVEKVQYKQYLQAEKPHSEEKRGKRKEKSRSHDESEHVTLKIRDDMRGDCEGRDGNGEVKTDSADLMERTDVDKVSHGKGGNHDRHEMTQCKKKDPGERTSSLKVRQASQDEEERRRVRQERESGRRVETRGGVPRPVHSRSPARLPPSVSSAIGQTVSEHLFDGSVSGVLSSVDSWASVTDQPPASPSVSRSDQPPDPPVSTDQREAETTGEQQPACAEYESDGDFPEDHILKMLRHQRADYEIKLRQIDDLLQQSSFGGK